MVVEWYERLLSHRMVDDIRLPAYHWTRCRIPWGNYLHRVPQTKGNHCQHPLQGDGFGSVLYFEWLCDVKHPRSDKKGNFEVEITWRARKICIFSALEPVTLKLLRYGDHRWGPVRLVGAGFGSYLNPSLSVGQPQP